VAIGAYDLINRLTRKDIFPGAGVSDDTTFEDYKYDGLSRFIHVQDNDSLVTRSYDSLSRISRETLNSQTTTTLYDGVGNMLSCTYPGGRVVACTYDELERKKTISDQSGQIATYDYIGPDRVTRREYGNGTRSVYRYDGITGIANPANDFGVKRLIRTTHTKTVDGTVIDDRTYTWDQMYNKTQRKDVRTGGPELTHDYTYDSIYRLIRSDKTPPGGSADTINYSLDGVGNRTSVAGGPDPGPYTMVATVPEPADRQTNQYTTTSVEARLYDKNGNLIRIDDGQPTQRAIAYDYRNQMISHINTATLVATTYAYDALGRRIQRVVNDGAAETTRYFYTDWRVCEEQDVSSSTLATYVIGRYIDEVLTMRRGGDDFFHHTDDLYSVVAITNASDAAVERYEYEDFGEPLFMDASVVVIGSSAIGNPYAFTGRRFDNETAWYYYRTRYLDPLGGRFTIRDDIGIWSDLATLGNGYAYVANRAATFLDPLGRRGTLCGGNLQGSREESLRQADDYAEEYFEDFLSSGKDVMDLATREKQYLEDRLEFAKQEGIRDWGAYLRTHGLHEFNVRFGTHHVTGEPGTHYPGHQDRVDLRRSLIGHFIADVVKPAPLPRRKAGGRSYGARR
ncbi:MAG: hypothetical protein IH987_03235, partial [Planctomycetes bacterium]|nr:hypothetical protein [Planctomycetota bacterium]